MKRDDEEPERPRVVPIRPAEEAPEEDVIDYWAQYDEDVRSAERALAAALVRRAEARSHRERESAEADLERAIGLDNDCGAAWYRLAIIAWDDAEALAYVNAALVCEPANASYYGCRAEIHHRLEERERALADYDRAVHLEQERDCIMWLLHRARLADEMGRWDDAWRDFTRAFEKRRDEPYILRERAMVLAHRGDLEGARRELDRVIAAHPTTIAAVREKALLCQRMGDSDEALRSIDAVLAALARDPERRDAFDHYVRGAILASRGAWAEAAAAFERGKREARDAQFAIRRAQCFFALGRLREATRACDRAVAEDPRHEGFRLWRARVRRAAGDGRGALEDVRAAMRRAPEDARFVAEKAAIHAASGRPALARSEARRALRMMRKHAPPPRAYHALLERYEARGLDLGHAPPVSRAELERLASG